MFVILLAAIFIGSGCASVEVKAPKDPIKVDVTMRVDVYQHVEQDIDAIEDIVTGGAGITQSFISALVPDAYAESGLSKDAEEAAYRRKGRYAELSSSESKGIIGEKANGLVEIRDQNAGADASGLVSSENSDRMVIYNSIAAKNGISVSEVQKMYAEKLQNSAPAGTPIETSSGSWQKK